MSQKLMDGVLKSLKETLIKSAIRSLKSKEAEECSKRITAIFDHNMAGGKHQRSRLALNTFLALSPKASEDDIFKAAKVSGTMEMVQTYFLILDDIMDQSKFRRGRPCWYTVPEIGLQAINDSFIIDCGIDKVVRDTIPHHPNKEIILATIADAKFKTVVGQFLDGGSTTVETCKWDRYAQLVQHKTSHYSFYCPLAIGFQLADILHYSNEYQKIAYDIGYLFQAQDDFLDIFGDEKVTGKTSADIANGKCTWISCKTVEKISNDAKAFDTFKESFGKSDPEKVAVARQIIYDLKIDNDFIQFQNQAVKSLHEKIDNFEKIEVRQLLHSLVEALIGRKT